MEDGWGMVPVLITLTDYITSQRTFITQSIRSLNVDIGTNRFNVSNIYDINGVCFQTNAVNESI